MWKANLIVGYCFLFLMAMFWSVDNSLVLILFGVAAFFLFMGFYTKPSSKKFNASDDTTDRQSRPLWFGNWNKSTSKSTFAKPFTKPGTQQANQQTVKLIVLCVFGVFFFFTVGSIFTSSDEFDESRVHFQNGQNDYWSGDYNAALINYRRAWKSNPEDVEALLGYGNTLSALQQMDSALIIFDEALRIDPDYKEAGYYKAFVYYNQQKYGQSIEVLLPLLNENQEYYDAMLLIGDGYYALQKLDDAINWYSNAYENGQERSQALCYIMGYIYDTKADYARAVPLYKEALSYDSSMVDIHKRLGELLPGTEGDYYRTQALKLRKQ